MCFRSDKDDAGRQLNPAEIPSATAIQPSGDATELGEKGMSTLDRTADAAHSRHAGASAFGRLHAKARRVGAGSGRAVAIGTIRTGTGQIPRIRLGYWGFRRRRLHYHRLEHRLGLDAIVGARLGHHDAQR
jgi:hypothetical protein